MYIGGVRPLMMFHYLIGALATLVLAPPVIVLSLVGWPRAAYVPVRLWARLLHLITGVRFRVHGLENVPATSSFVAVSNHCSHLDGPALVLALPHPVYFVIKKELARIPLWGLAVVRLGFVAVDRSDSEQARAAMHRAVESIRAGKRILTFAEGTRSLDGRLQPFKKGGFHLAIDAQVPILPLTVNGSHHLFPKGAASVRPGTLDVIIGRPIATAGLEKDDLEDLMSATRDAILSARRQDPHYPHQPPAET
jgi:1-acyl-sn-glycerol-3-phosphate acyltransferase